MAYRIDWVDATNVRFRETEQEPDGLTIWATWSQAKAEALAQAQYIEDRDDWDRCTRNIRQATPDDAVQS